MPEVNKLFKEEYYYGYDNQYEYECYDSSAVSE